MSCITPIAPTWLFAFWSSCDSWYPCAAIEQVVHLVLVAVLLKNPTRPPSNFFRSASEVACFANVVLTRYRFSIMLPNAVPRPYFARNSLSSASELRAVLADRHREVAPVRTVTVSCTVMFGNTFFQNSAR